MRIGQALIVCLMTICKTAYGYEASFDVPLVNVTVKTGQLAVLPCAIDHLKKHKVTWSKTAEVEGQMKLNTLTLETNRLIDDYRFTVAHPNVKEWNLHISDVHHADRGRYLCTINTQPVRSKQVVLYVNVPPEIEDYSGDVTAQENDTVSLSCHVTGIPKPEVTWYRMPADQGDKRLREKIQLTGEVLVLENITRDCEDIYECIADNNVKPRVSRSMKVSVQFPPEIHLDNVRIRQALGLDTMLECKVTAYPHATIYWEKGGKQIVSKGGKYEIEIYDDTANVKILSLNVLDVSADDYGVYTCVASNNLGRAAKTMVLAYYAEKPRAKETSQRMYVIIPYHSTQNNNNGDGAVNAPPSDYETVTNKPGHAWKPPDNEPVAGKIMTDSGVSQLSSSALSHWSIICHVLCVCFHYCSYSDYTRQYPASNQL